MVPQKVSFVRMKKEVSVQPNDGFATLLPNEIFTFDVSFSPSSVVPYSFDLCLTTSVNDKYPIHIIGTGVESPLTLR